MLNEGCHTCVNIKNCSKKDIARNMPCKDYKIKRGKKNVETSGISRKSCRFRGTENQ